VILVCGGAGYIGSHAVHRLASQRQRVVVVDNLTAGHRAAVPPGVPFYRGDLRDRSTLENIFEEHDVSAVLHFAASSLVGESMEKPLEYYDNNVYGTQVLLETMRDHAVEQLVFSSSAAVYGEPKELPIQEDAVLRPESPYGETKLTIERMLYWAHRAYGLRYISLRYFNVAGALGSELGEDHRPETHLIPLVLQVPLGKRDCVYIFGDDYDTRDGTCVRDYIHVMDLVDAHLLALQWLTRGGQSGSLNLGSESGFSVLEVIEAARRVTGHPVPVEWAPRRPGDPARLVASAARARRVLGWRPIRSRLEDIVASAWEWHRSNPEGFRGE